MTPSFTTEQDAVSTSPANLMDASGHHDMVTEINPSSLAGLPLSNDMDTDLPADMIIHLENLRMHDPQPPIADMRLQGTQEVYKARHPTVDTRGTSTDNGEDVMDYLDHLYEQRKTLTTQTTAYNPAAFSASGAVAEGDVVSAERGERRGRDRERRRAAPRVSKSVGASGGHGAGKAPRSTSRSRTSHSQGTRSRSRGHSQPRDDPRSRSLSRTHRSPVKSSSIELALEDALFNPAYDGSTPWLEVHRWHVTVDGGTLRDHLKGLRSQAAYPLVTLTPMGPDSSADAAGSMPSPPEGVREFCQLWYDKTKVLSEKTGKYTRGRFQFNVSVKDTRIEGQDAPSDSNPRIKGKVPTFYCKAPDESRMKIVEDIKRSGRGGSYVVSYHYFEVVQTVAEESVPHEPSCHENQLGNADTYGVDLQLL